MVLFCHGGVWASGAKWHYSPMGSALAQLGVISVMMQYTLYPDAVMPQLVEELAQCLDWVQVGLCLQGCCARSQHLQPTATTLLHSWSAVGEAYHCLSCLSAGYI